MTQVVINESSEPISILAFARTKACKLGFNAESANSWSVSFMEGDISFRVTSKSVRVYVKEAVQKMPQRVADFIAAYQAELDDWINAPAMEIDVVYVHEV